MAVSMFFSIAYRNLARNRRRTALTALAVALSLVVTMVFASLIAGTISTMVADGIRLSTGHLQIRAESYDEDKVSLLAKDLLQDGQAWSARAEAMPGVRSAAPVLWSGGLMSTAQESSGIQIVGIDPDDSFHAPIREGIVAGEYLESDDRGRVLLGRALAERMDIAVGGRVSVTASDANGQGQEGIFTVSGLVDTGFTGIDQSRIILPLEQAQAFGGVGDRFSSLILMLDDQEEVDAIAASFAGPEAQTLTWRFMNKLLVDSVVNAMAIYYIIYGILFVAVAILIANTLLMSVFSRAREIGILSSLGMTSRQIRRLFVIEGMLVAILGIMIGLVLGLGAVAYLTFAGVSFSTDISATVEGLAFGSTIYGAFVPGEFAVHAVMLLIIVSLASLYPATLAARMEPVEALHTV